MTSAPWSEVWCNYGIWRVPPRTAKRLVWRGNSLDASDKKSSRYWYFVEARMRRLYDDGFIP